MREKGKEEKKKIYILHIAHNIAKGCAGKEEVEEKKGEGKGKERPFPQDLFFE